MLRLITTFLLLFSPFTWSLTLTGSEEQGGLLFAKVPADTQVWFNDKPLMVSKAGYIVIGFDRDAKAGDMLTWQQGAKTKQSRRFNPRQRQYKKQYIKGIKKSIMKPNPKAVARSRDDARQVRAARAKRLELENFHFDFIWPLKGPITGVFGSQRVYNGEPRRPHYGLDIAAKTGTLVSAPAGGVVTLAHKDMFYSGGTLIIDHGNGLSSSFLHLSDILVAVGDKVKQGQSIAKVGASGRATGPHLDWRMNWLDRRVDPRLLLPSQQ